MKNDSTVFVGLDVHKDSIVAAYSVGLGEVQILGHVGVCDRDIDKLCVRQPGGWGRPSHCLRPLTPMAYRFRARSTGRSWMTRPPARFLSW